MNKLDDSDFINEISKYDILIFTECWISKFSNVNINGYECFVCPRQKCNKKAKRSSGGITVYFKHHLSQKISLIKRNTKGILWFKVDKSVFDNVTDRYFCVCYIPPESSNVYRNRSSELFQFDFFNQLSIDIDTEHRKALAKLRTSNHSLCIETGRHKNIDRFFRICPYCDLFDVKVLENEYHFVMECPLYCDLREYYIGNIIAEYNDMNIFCNILKTQNVERLRNLGAYVYNASVRRQSIFK